MQTTHCSFQIFPIAISNLGIMAHPKQSLTPHRNHVAPKRGCRWQTLHDYVSMCRHLDRPDKKNEMPIRINATGQNLKGSCNKYCDAVQTSGPFFTPFASLAMWTTRTRPHSEPPHIGTRVATSRVPPTEARFARLFPGLPSVFSCRPIYRATARLHVPGYMIRVSQLRLFIS